MIRSALALALALSLALAGTALAASVGVTMNGHYAVEGSSFGGGSVIHKSGTDNYLRATAHGDVIQTLPVMVPISIRQGSITSGTGKFGGANGGRINWTVRGSFSRTLSGGISIANGAIFQHRILFYLIDQTQSNKVLGSWTFVNDSILCGGIVYPVGLGGCNDATSDTFASSFSLTTTGTTVKTNDLLKIKVSVITNITAEGIGIGLDAKTQATGMSGTIAW